MQQEIFSPEEKALLQDLGTPLTIPPQGMVYFQGDPADKIYYIRKGRVRVFQNTASGREVNLDVVEAGHIIGESAFAPGQVRPACVQAVNTVQLVSFRQEDLTPHFQARPTLALHFLQQCSNTMDRLTSRLREQCLLDRFGKTASFILDLTATDSPEKGTVGGSLPYTHENIAESLGLSRSTVTMVLGRFEKLGWVKSGYGKLQILDREALTEFVRQQLAQ